MSIFKALARIVVAPITVAAEVVRDISGDNGDTEQGISILTLGASSVVKGIGKAIKEAAEKAVE